MFLTKYGHNSWEFLMINLKKMTWDHFAFDRMDIFLKKIYRHQSRVFLRQWMSFRQNMGMRPSIFRENRKEMASYKLFWHIIYCSFDRIDVLNQIWAWLHGVVHENFLNNDMRAPCFFNFTFFDYMGMTVVCFPRMDVFLTEYGDDRSDFL